MHFRLTDKLNWRLWVLPWLSPLMATAFAMALRPVFATPNLAMIYLVAVLITAVSTSIRPALICAVLSFISYNFFLTEPYYSLLISHREDLLTGLMLIAVALITAPLTARLSEQLEALRASESWSMQQMQAASLFSGLANAEEIIRILKNELHNALHWHVTSHDTTRQHKDTVEQSCDILITEDPAGFSIAFWDHNRQCAAILRLAATSPVQDWHRERVDALVKLARLAWTRVQLTDSLRQETLEKEREQLRSALLSSISHDLRTPLSAMIGSVSSLIDLADSLNQSQRDELLNNTLSEARRLDRYIQKLLDMTRLGHGELSLDRDWIGLDDIISVVLRRGQSLLGGIRIRVEMPEDMPLLHVHPALIEQAIFNVLENAIRFSPPNGEISLTASSNDDCLDLDIHDEGPGIATEDSERVFDMFHSVSHGDQMQAGTGLGLTICRSILVAHGGQVSVLPSNPQSTGTTFRISLPIHVPTELPKEDQ
ncbi:sensor histidine kinase [Pseudohongiella spirulinae]|uniref:histidine kinase n=1 Tax=Pseudohongiella spirulinae TaxID=1249552 RepID=A0A0S2KFW5_9GAMM|nr:ATP-binding protein [Pseudohongiella spirulinae]ALO46863.1 Osmosensitive K+ channel histidine kinase KdpD [Pseudohongiella spirulinae]